MRNNYHVNVVMPYLYKFVFSQVHFVSHIQYYLEITKTISFFWGWTGITEPVRFTRFKFQQCLKYIFREKQLKGAFIVAKLAHDQFTILIS